MTALTIIETGEIVEAMTEVEAERITSRIADKLDAIADNLEQVLPLIGEALTREAWKALGYLSPGAYVEERFSTALHRLPIPVRRPVVSVLSEAGMSTREIAPVVGVGPTTVKYDIAGRPNSGGHIVTTSPDATVADVIAGANFPTSSTIRGRDGKDYSRPAPAPVEDAEEIEEAPAPRRPAVGRNKDLLALQNAVAGISGYALALAHIEDNGLDNSVTPEDAANLHRELARANRTLNKILNNLNQRKQS